VAVAERWAFRDRVPGDRPQASAPAATVRDTDDGAPVYDPGVMAKLPMVKDGSDPGYPQLLLEVFDRSVRQILDSIEQAITAGDLKVVLRGVHSMKSSAGQVGALAMASEAGRCEAALRRGEQGTEALRGMLQRLQGAHASFSEAVGPVEPVGPAGQFEASLAG
jgi:HPt (histidine-containing phosphotransfer) domain-containing protein